jgi:hypothetical protein
MLDRFGCRVVIGREAATVLGILTERAGRKWSINDGPTVEALAPSATQQVNTLDTLAIYRDSISSDRLPEGGCICTDTQINITRRNFHPGIAARRRIPASFGGPLAVFLEDSAQHGRDR